MPSAAQPTTLFVVDAASLSALPTQIEQAQLAAQLTSPLAAKPELLNLTAEQDGILQITAALSQRSGLSSLHLVSSGEAGSLQLGATQLTLFNLDRYGWELQQWGESLAAEAEIVLHEGWPIEGLASQFSGAFLSRLHLLTGAKIRLTRATQPQRLVGF